MKQNTTHSELTERQVSTIFLPSCESSMVTNLSFEPETVTGSDTAEQIQKPTTQLKPGMVAHVCNPNTQKGKARLGPQGYPQPSLRTA